MLVVEGEFACMVETVVVPSARVKARVNMPREDTTRLVEEFGKWLVWIDVGFIFVAENWYRVVKLFGEM